MEFSESLNIGNSTYMNLENLVKHAIDENGMNRSGCDQATAALDTINESPTNYKTFTSGSRSRFLGVTTSRASSNSKGIKHANHNKIKNEPKICQFRKTKSDSNLDVVLVDRRSIDGQLENYSDFFRSGFSIEEQKEQYEELLMAAKPKTSALMRVSQLEAALQERNIEIGVDCSNNNNVLSKLDAAIFSEDIQDLISDTDEELKIQEHTEIEKQEDLWHDSLIFSELSNVNDHQENPNQSKFLPDVDEPKFDEASFIMCGDKSVEQNAIVEELERSKREIRRAMLEDPHLDMNKVTTKITTKKSNKVYCSPTKQVHEIVQNSKDKSERLHHNRKVLKNIADWQLPSGILREYEKKGINKMFDWQIECLSNPKVLFDHCNLVYSAPTSAGKTLVSEILLIKTIIEREKKVLLILPFISVVREKMFYLQDLLLPSGYRVEGFFGGYIPPGGFDSINVAICTIEKANAIVNKLLEQGKLADIGIVVVDEVHLISDPGRGYILELLLAKILYISRKNALHIQVVTMSATLANVNLLQRWLKAELYVTTFRPVALQEMIKIGNKIFDCNMKQLREINLNESYGVLQNDGDQVAQLCIETLLEGCSVVVFCPSKDWCEKLAIQLAGAIHALGKSGTELGLRLRANLKRDDIDELKRQLKDIPTGLDAVLERTITFACAFHHAGMTLEERDLIETGFKSGALKVIVATSTLSSGVNLPARRVLIRTPLFGGKQMSSLTYRQMIGRAGRTGKDTLGESILVCTESNARIGRELITAGLKPISSCLEMESSTHLKRALLEVISSGVALTKQDIINFVNCTLLSTEKVECSSSEDEVIRVANNTMESMPSFIKESLDFLIEYEFIRLQIDEETNVENYMATRLGLACLASSMPPTDGLILFAELQKSRRCFVLESELHAVYLVTPYSVCSQLQEIDWLLYLDMWEKLKPAMKKVGELVGIKESFLVRAMRGQSNLDYKLMQIHKRFYTALALQELVNETPINEVALKYKCNRGMLQSLQQMASTFAGIVTAFCNSLNWSTLALIVSQFKERLFFGIHRDLIDLMRLPDLNHKRARALYDGGITNLIELANADSFTVEKVLYNALSFDTIKQHDNENVYETERRNIERNFFITGKLELTVREASKVLVQNARLFVQYEIGVGNIHWSQSQSEAVKETSEQQIEHKEDQKCSDEELKLDDTSRKQLKRKNDETAQKLNTAKLVKAVKDEKTTNKLMNSCDNKYNATVKETEILSENGSKVLQTERSANETENNADKLLIPLKIFEKASKIITAHTNKPLASKANLQDKQTEDKHKSNSSPELEGNTAKREEVTFHQNLEPISKLNKINSEIQMPKASVVTRSIEVSIAQPSGNSKTTSTKLPLKQVTTKPQVKLLPKEGNFSTPPAKMSSVVDKLKTPKEFQSSRSDKHKLPNPLHATTANKTPRRSPRNHLASSTCIQKTETLPKNADLELFMNEDESFEMNTGIANVLEAADKLLNVDTPPIKSSDLNRTNDDEIPSSQKIEEDIEPRVQTPQRSRFLRSYRAQRIESPKIQKQQQAPTVALPPTPPPTTSSIELSDISVGNSLMQNPQQLNASEILTCLAEDSEAIDSHFKSVEIIDICANQTLFKSAFKELNAAQRLGVSFGLKKDTNKRKPLIGANLLNNPDSKDTESIKDVQFSLDDASSSYLAGVAFSMRENIIYFMNMQDTDTCKGLTKELKCKYLRLLFKSSELTLLMHDAKEQLKVLRKVIPTLTEICVHLQDPKVANWLLQPDKNLSFAKMVEQFAPECMRLVKLCGSERSYSSLGLNADSTICAKVRCSVEACITTYILKGQIENLERLGSGQLIKFFNELEMPLQLSLCNMETYGFPTSESALRQLFHKMVEAMKKLEAKIFELHGARFNLGSTSAVARVLGLHRKTNGRVSTSRQILEKIDSPISQLIITYRKLNVTLTKNIQPLLKCVINNRIHGQSVTFTSTGRISMTDPNLQNVAKDFLIDLGVTDKITISCRSAFFAIDDKRCLISSDFCQLEMRILAHLSQDATLLQVINSDTDVFTALAARWNKIAEDKVSEQLRNGTKQICYGIVYGMGMRSLAEALKCTEEEASCVSEQFHAAYPGIRAYTEKVIKFARHKGYIETITGRRRYLEHINSSELQFKKQAERQAINSTIQGSAADIAKSAMTRMENNITKYREKLGIESTSSVQLVLHLHDELIYEVPEEKAKKVAKILRVTMENCVKLNVPLKVKIKIGKSWGSLKEVNL